MEDPEDVSQSAQATMEDPIYYYRLRTDGGSSIARAAVQSSRGSRGDGRAGERCQVDGGAESKEVMMEGGKEVEEVVGGGGVRQQASQGREGGKRARDCLCARPASVARGQVRLKVARWGWRAAQNDDTQHLGTRLGAHDTRGRGARERISVCVSGRSCCWAGRPVSKQM
jgi:hypothetical protein